MYHINLKGEVHECTAERACPFGDFEKDHFTTREQARAAYEGTMAGQNVKTFNKKEKYLELLQDKNEAEQAALKAKLEKYEKMEKPVTKVRPAPEKGYYRKVNKVEDLKKSDILPNGGKVSSIQRGFIYYRHEGDTKSSKIPVADFTPGTYWRDEIDPEEQRAYEADLFEQNIENIALNYFNFKNRANIFLAGSKNSKDIFKQLRKFKHRAGELQKSQISHPYTRAMEVVFQNYETRHYDDVSRSVKFILTGNEQGVYKPYNSAFGNYLNRDLRESVKQIFKENQAIFQDNNPINELEERKQLGLL